MKQFFVLFALLSATAAHATTVKIDTVDAYVNPPASTGGEVSLQYFKFEVNADNGRARVLLGYYSPTGGGDDSAYGPGENRVLVAGLTFDAERSQVVFKNSDGKVTACAAVAITQGPFGRRIKIKNTSSCTLSSAIEDIATDDGWEIKHRKVLNVFLNVQD